MDYVIFYGHVEHKPRVEQGRIALAFDTKEIAQKIGSRDFGVVKTKLPKNTRHINSIFDLKKNDIVCVSCHKSLDDKEFNLDSFDCAIEPLTKKDLEDFKKMRSK